MCWLGCEGVFFKLLCMSRVKWDPVSLLCDVALIHGYMTLWEHMCLLQRSPHAILNTLIVTRAAGSAHLPKVKQLLPESRHTIPKVSRTPGQE